MTTLEHCPGVVARVLDADKSAGRSEDASDEHFSAEPSKLAPDVVTLARVDILRTDEQHRPDVDRVREGGEWEPAATAEEGAAPERGTILWNSFISEEGWHEPQPSGGVSATRY